MTNAYITIRMASTNKHIKTNKHHLLRHAEIGAALCVSAGGWGAVGELMIFLYHVQTAR